MLTVGDADRVNCLQLTGPRLTSIGWYDPQGQLVSRDDGDEVYQTGTGGGRVAYLNFQNYTQRQGGKYECRVAVPGKNLEKLPICIGECYTLGDGRLFIASIAQTVQVTNHILRMCIELFGV